MAASAAVMALVFVAAAGFSIWGVLIAVLLDAVGFGLAVLYLLLLRTYVPAFLGLQASADAFVVNELIAPMLVGFFVTRLVSYFIARACSYTSPSSKKTHAPPA